MHPSITEEIYPNRTDAHAMIAGMLSALTTDNPMMGSSLATWNTGDSETVAVGPVTLAMFACGPGDCQANVDAWLDGFLQRPRNPQPASPPPAPSQVSPREQLAVALLDAGRFDEAITLLEQAVAENENIFGNQHPQTAHARNELAGLYQITRQWGKAIVKYQQVVDTFESALGKPIRRPPKPGAASHTPIWTPR